MKIFLYVMAAILVIVWALAFLMLNSGGIVHFLIVLALALIVINKAHSKQMYRTKTGADLGTILFRNNMIK